MPTVRFLGPDTDAYVDSVVRHADEFRDLSGLELDITIIPSDEYFSNRIQPYLDGETPADVFMSGPVLLWEHMGREYVQPLGNYLDRAGSGFDFSDFLPPLIRDNTWSGRFGDPLGEGELWELPVNCETYNLAINGPVAEKYSVAVPQTWDDYFGSAADVQEKAGVRGFAQRGIQVWHTMYTGYATQFWSYGARDFDESGACAIASPDAVRATELFVAALKACGPADWANQRWYELAMDFAAGKYLLIVDSDHYVAFFEDDASSLRGSITYAAPPAGPGGLRTPNMWTWSLVMNSRSRNKDGAWRFMEWASGREFLHRSAFEGNMNPTRRSIWDDERFLELASGWGSFAEVSRDLIENRARVLVTPFARYREVADRWVRALIEAYQGAPVAQALTAAATDIDNLVTGTE